MALDALSPQRITGALRTPVAWLLAQLIAWLPAAIGAELGLVPAVLGASVAVVVLVSLARQLSPSPLLPVTLLAASAVIPSGLVPSAYQYAPIAVVSAALAADFAWVFIRRPRTITLPASGMLVILAAYVAWAIISTLFSIDLRLSLVYAMGIVATLVIAFVVVPSMVVPGSVVRLILQALVVLGLIAALFDVVLAVVGPTTLFDRQMGRYLITELTLGGSRTGIVAPWASGPFGSPAAEAEILAAGLVACLWLWETGSTRARAAYAGCVLVLLLALLAAMSRTGWVAGILGAGALAGYGLYRRRIMASAVITSVFLALVLGLSLSDNLGAILRPDLEVAHYVGQPPGLPSATPGGVITDPDLGQEVGSGSPGRNSALVVRGGTSVSGRLAIWRASIDAAFERPIAGSGPGTDAVAIQPLLTDGLTGYQGLSSHSTWLRTAVELGFPGLLLLLAFTVTSLLLFARLLRRRDRTDTGFDRGAALPAVAAIFIALIGVQTFETSLLGGWTFVALIWAVCAGLAVPEPARRREVAPAGG